MSTSDSGKGASVSEDYEHTGKDFSSKPVKQVHFMDQQKPAHQITPVVTAPTNGHYQLLQKPMGRNSPTPMSTFSNNSPSFGNGTLANSTKGGPYGDRGISPRCDTSRPYVERKVNPSQANCQPAPISQQYKNHTYSPGGTRRAGTLPHQRPKELKKFHDRGATLGHPRYREDDNVNGIIGNLSDGDSDGNSTISGSYVLVADELPSHVHHLSRLKDSVV